MDNATKANSALPITTARARLFDLVEDVLTGQRPRVELSHRSYQEHVVLLRKSELEGLEADLRALRSRIGPEPRQLRGIAHLHVPADEVLQQTRTRQAQLAAEKRADFGKPGDGAEADDQGT